MRTIPRHRRDLIDRMLRTFGRDALEPAGASVTPIPPGGETPPPPEDASAFGTAGNPRIAAPAL